MDSARAVSARRRAGKSPSVFLFFSNRLGCGGSLLVSAAVTIVLLIALDVI
jgi:hypothetical protein